MRKLFNYMAAGNEDMPDSWFVGLKADSSESVSSAASREREKLYSINCSKLLDGGTRYRQQTTDMMVVPDMDSMEVNNTAADINRITAIITSKLQQDPATYLKAAKAMVRNFENISTTNRLVF